MVFAVSPRHTSADFKGRWTLDDKIEVFIARVEGWQLGVANEIIKKDIVDRDFALLHIVISFFEMISKYNSGFIGDGNSKEHFKKGVRHVFPEIEPEAEAFLDYLYRYVRNGLYHIGRPASNVIISANLPGSVGYNAQNDAIMVSPDQLVQDITLRFAAYAKALRDPANSQLRSNFEKRFDYDNKLILKAGIA
jgi:hypothetical protein